MAAAAVSLPPLLLSEHMPRGPVSPMQTAFPTSPGMPMQGMMSPGFEPVQPAYPASPTLSAIPDHLLPALIKQSEQLAGIKVQTVTITVPLYSLGFADLQDFEQKRLHAIQYFQLLAQSNANTTPQVAVPEPAATAQSHASVSSKSSKSKDRKGTSNNALHDLPFVAYFYNLQELLAKATTVRAKLGGQNGQALPAPQGEQVSFHSSARPGYDTGCCFVA